MPKNKGGRKPSETNIVFYGEPSARRQRSASVPKAVRLRSGVTLGFPTMRRWHKALKRALESPRSASTARNLTDMAADIAALLGPAMDPYYIPEVKPLAAGYVLTMPDGTEHTMRTMPEAALHLGLVPASLRVMLSKGKGTYKRTTEEGTITLRRVYAEGARA